MRFIPFMKAHLRFQNTALKVPSLLPNFFCNHCFLFLVSSEKCGQLFQTDNFAVGVTQHEPQIA
ncbi:hypothetical protein AAU61_17035 [Desulfocarbo indianensis]|nr:hypothetical protein AAU61_17035 [Desulfocarbo indianensis]